MTEQTEQTSEHQRQPDIEVYIKDISVEEITTWLNTVFDNVEIQGSIDKSSINFHCITGEHLTPLTIYIGAAGKLYTSLWFQSDKTPWGTDIECATQIAETLDKEVRCSTSGWEESDDTDNQWWKITKEDKAMVTW